MKSRTNVSSVSHLYSSQLHRRRVGFKDFPIWFTSTEYTGPFRCVRRKDNSTKVTTDLRQFKECRQGF